MKRLGMMEGLLANAVMGQWGIERESCEEGEFLTGEEDVFN